MIIRIQNPVLHGDIRHRSDAEADSDEPEVLFSRGLEHLRFYHRRSLASRAGSGGRAGFVGVAVIQIGECHARLVIFHNYIELLMRQSF